jgi:hypothetical protein
MAAKVHLENSTMPRQPSKNSEYASGSKFDLDQD